MIVAETKQNAISNHTSPAGFDPIEQARHSRDTLLAELGNHSVSGNNCRCPARDHDDRHPSAGVYQGDDRAWRVKCHSCGFCGDVYDVQAELTGRSVEDVLKAARGNLVGLIRNGTASPPATSKPSPASPLIPVEPADLETLRPLAQSLGVSSDSLVDLNIARHDGCWIIPERDAAGTVIGQQRRYNDGKKKHVYGTKRGLTYKHPLPNDAGGAASDPCVRR